MTIKATVLAQAQFASAVGGTVYTSPNATTTIIDKFTATNTDSSTRTLSVYLVPEGGSVSASNAIIDGLSIATDTTVDITSLQNQILGPGDTIFVSASVGSVVNIRASGRQVT